MASLETIQGQHASIFGEVLWLTSEQVMLSKQRKVLYERHNDKDFFVIKVPYKKEGIRGVMGLSIDISKLKQAERTKSMFTMNMGHEIRTPFCGIITVLELLYAKEKDINKRELLEMSLYSSRRLLDFMNDIQEVSRIGHLPLDDESCDMKVIVKDIVKFLRSSIEMKGLKIEVSCASDDIMINRYRIEKILLNLLGNAVKFTEQGVITVSIKTSPILTIVVSDTGIGIDKKYHEKIFESFFQAVSCYKKVIMQVLEKDFT
ncbi:sensor histidine kinase [Rickettsiella endosymbiont of Dermanyssus gallinae]|uniref:sensor histidine kinase n=1 Tax=Rickettsiella endosymbiont of Dermanyssus gallinae TaxID=2856608 RepID=UPI001C52A7C9|nr:ATP-binding protein [Rickettsiella endosymbiont of Dermanyssus gallinae]